MKRSELFFNIASIFADIISLTLAALVSFYVRIRVISLPVHFAPDLGSYMRVAWQAIPVLLVLFALFGLYNLKGTRNFLANFQKIAGAISAALFVLLLVLF